MLARRGFVYLWSITTLFQYSSVVSVENDPTLFHTCSLTPENLQDFEAILEENHYSFEKGTVSRLTRPLHSKSSYIYYFLSPLTESLTLCIPPPPGSELPISNLPNLHDFHSIHHCPAETSALFQLETDESIVIVGCSPPEMPFYSFQHFVQYQKDVVLGWRHTFASLGQSINVDSIVTERPAEPALDRPFENLFALTLSANVHTAVNVASYINEMSPDKLDLNILAIPGTLLPDVPSSSLKLGTESNSDLFSCYLKMARSSGTTSAKLQRYLDQPPLAVYRVRPQQKVELTTFPPPKLVFPSKNATENSLISGFVMLEKAVVENLEHGGYVASKNWFTLPGSSLYGKQWAGDCCTGWSSLYSRKCYGVSHDLNSFFVFPRLDLHAQDDLYVIGVNHRRTGMATGLQIGLLNMHSQLNFTRGISLDVLEGSADRYFESSIVQDLSLFYYVAKFSNNCQEDERFCFGFRDDDTENDGDSDVGDKVSILPIVQSFLNPETGLTFDDETHDVIRPMYLVARKKIHATCDTTQDCNLENRVLNFFSYPSTAMKLDWLLLYAFGQEYTVALIITYLFACICAASILHFPMKQ